MRKEIGSEFWDIPVSINKNCLFPKKTRWFISGTAALEYILRDIIIKQNIRTAAIPSWCCGCMITPFIKYGITIKFYPVYYEEGRLICDYRDIIADCWIVLSYFGYSTQFTIGNPNGIIIRDLTHSVFSMIDYDADYYFGSLRKWAGFYTGGYAWCNKWNKKTVCPDCDPAYIALRRNAMRQKCAYIDGQIASKNYRALFEEGEEFLDHCEPMNGYKKDIEKARYLDIQYLRKRRWNNANTLLKGLKEVAIFPEIKEYDCPLFVPILLVKERRKRLQEYLVNNEVYCPIHWPIEQCHILSDRTKALYDMEISIVCDQRYDEDDMKRIIKLIFDSGVL